MMKIYHLLSVAVLGLCSAAANANTTWFASDGNTNFIDFTYSGAAFSTNGGHLNLISTLSSNALDLGVAGAQVNFAMGSTIDNSLVAGDWYAYINGTDAKTASIDLGAMRDFQLGMDWGAGMAGVYGSPVSAGDNAWIINFKGMGVTGKTIYGNTLGVDLNPVPVPAAAWLFGTGLIGLVGVARRRRA